MLGSREEAIIFRSWGEFFASGLGQWYLFVLLNGFVHGILLCAAAGSFSAIALYPDYVATCTGVAVLLALMGSGLVWNVCRHLDERQTGIRSTIAYHCGQLEASLSTLSDQLTVANARLLFQPSPASQERPVGRFHLRDVLRENPECALCSGPSASSPVSMCLQCDKMAHTSCLADWWTRSGKTGTCAHCMTNCEFFIEMDTIVTGQ